MDVPDESDGFVDIDGSATLQSRIHAAMATFGCAGIGGQNRQTIWPDHKSQLTDPTTTGTIAPTMIIPIEMRLRVDAPKSIENTTQIAAAQRMLATKRPHPTL
jgi:hypothetical protein